MKTREKTRKKNKLAWILSLISFAVLTNTFIKDSVIVKAATVQDIQKRTEDRQSVASNYITVQDLRKYGRPDPDNIFVNKADVWHKENTYYAVDDYTGYIYQVTFYPTSDKIKSLTPVKKNNKRIKSEAWEINNDDNEKAEKQHNQSNDNGYGIVLLVILMAPLICFVLLF